MANPVRARLFFSPLVYSGSSPSVWVQPVLVMVVVVQTTQHPRVAKQSRSSVLRTKSDMIQEKGGGDGVPGRDSVGMTCLIPRRSRQTSW
ncbi:hypothetical protein LX32DRAFT_199162 [Colletotrichum zoysiae]|uniref:Uncharacterized protein n=1 Tax=Colletotrichum zoysiae TaxID=1216348 RepID=A0AAD9HQN4_9PEZI|nr:hypothetical protein LX32DRAFT_199162 [Colletotrichum zoysiae]